MLNTKFCLFLNKLSHHALVEVYVLMNRGYYTTRSFNYWCTLLVPRQQNVDHQWHASGLDVPSGQHQ